MRAAPWWRGTGKDGSGLLPFLRFFFELLAAGAGELVILGFAIVVGDAPLGSDVAFQLQFQEGGIESAVIDGEEIAAGLLNAAGDAVAMERTESLQSFQDHQGQGALPDVGFVAHRAPMGKQ